jgi:hypothetical protein
MLHLRPSNCWRHDNGGESRDARFHKRHGRGYSSGTILHARRCADQGSYVRGPTRRMHFGALSSQCARSACVWRRSYNSGLARWHPRCSLIADFAGAFMQRRHSLCYRRGVVGCRSTQRSAQRRILAGRHCQSAYDPRRRRHDSAVASRWVVPKPHCAGVARASQSYVGQRDGFLQYSPDRDRFRSLLPRIRDPSPPDQ